MRTVIVTVLFLSLIPALGLADGRDRARRILTRYAANHTARVDKGYSLLGPRKLGAIDTRDAVTIRTIGLSKPLFGFIKAIQRPIGLDEAQQRLDAGKSVTLTPTETFFNPKTLYGPAYIDGHTTTRIKRLAATVRSLGHLETVHDQYLSSWLGGKL